MEERPLISVIIPTYNRAHFLREAIDSVLTQTYKNLELIVVDDGSTDNTSEIIRKFTDKRIDYICEGHGGTSAARNRGIRKANGSYIAFLDSDDIWLPEKIEKQLKIFQESKLNPGVVYTGIQYIDSHGNKKKQKKLSNHRGKILKQLLRKNIAGIGSTILVKRECFEKCGLFDESLPSRVDLDILIRICQHFTADFVPEILCLTRIHDERITADITGKIKSREILFEKIYPYLKRYRILLAKYLYETGKLYLKIGNTKKAKEYIVRSLKVFPLWRSVLALVRLNKK